MGRKLFYFFLKLTLVLCGFSLLMFGGPLLAYLNGEVNLDQSWRSASRESAHLAPSPYISNEDIVQVYSARTFNWRGLFGVHTWIATKNKEEQFYRTYQVIGWYESQGSVVVKRVGGIPDRYWFGNKPELLFDLRGEKAKQAIPKIKKAVENYPHGHEYTVWPGPNSNTFIAHILREVPELDVAMPALAIGKDYLPRGSFFEESPSNTGYQFSLFGYFGMTFGQREGVELNLLGQTFGLHFNNSELKIPGLGQVLWAEEGVTTAQK